MTFAVALDLREDSKKMEFFMTFAMKGGGDLHAIDVFFKNVFYKTI